MGLWRTRVHEKGAHIFEILRELGVLEVKQPANL